MKKRFLSLITVILITTLLAACSSSYDYDTYEEDDSWKTKKWNDLSGSEREKATDYMRDYIEEKNAY